MREIHKSKRLQLKPLSFKLSRSEVKNLSRRKKELAELREIEEDIRESFLLPEERKKEEREKLEARIEIENLKAARTEAKKERENLFGSSITVSDIKRKEKLKMKMRRYRERKREREGEGKGEGETRKPGKPERNQVARNPVMVFRLRVR